MPSYDAECPACGVQVEIYCQVHNRDKQKCVCGAILKRKVCAPAIKADDCSWSDENGGKGRYNPQTKMHHKNRSSVVEEAKRRNWDYSFG